MVPPPKPLPRATVVWEMANGPVAASMLAEVGSGPRWNGLVAADATGAALSPAATRAVMVISRSTALYLLGWGITQRKRAITISSTGGPGNCHRDERAGNRAVIVVRRDR